MAVSAACAIRPSRVVVDATTADRESLSGRWRGEYHAGADRSGQITFELRARDECAEGMVLLIPIGHESYMPASDRLAGEQPPPDLGAVLLTIRFVRARGPTVSGAVTPYWDPDRRCDARATFEGRLDGGRMTGTFVSTCTTGGPTINGRWAVARWPHMESVVGAPWSSKINLK